MLEQVDTEGGVGGPKRCVGFTGFSATGEWSCWASAMLTFEILPIIVSFITSVTRRIVAFPVNKQRNKSILETLLHVIQSKCQAEVERLWLLWAFQGWYWIFFWCWTVRILCRCLVFVGAECFKYRCYSVTYKAQEWTEKWTVLAVRT